jgi:hypothetical protein
MYKFLLVLFLVPLTISATENYKKGKYTKNKTIKKEFTVNADATLRIDNRYGDIVISSWEGNSVQIQIDITTNSDNEENAKERLDGITVEFDTNSTLVSAITKIKKQTSSWWSRKNNVSMEINYLVKVPVTNNVDLSNDYGGITLDRITGSAKINCDYGKLDIGRLENSNNSINIDYTNKSNVEFMKDGSINADYSTIHFEFSGRTKLNADYSHITFGKVVDLTYNCDYGSLKIEDVGNISGGSDYMHTKIETLRGSGNFNTDYGSIKIGTLLNNFKGLSVNSTYGHIKIGLSNNVSFNFNANLSYSGFKKVDGFNFTKEIVKGSKKEYVGTYGAAPNATISIKANYGSVSFTN